MERSEQARQTHEFMRINFSAFARKLMIALEGEKSLNAKVAHCTRNGIRFNGTAEHRSLLNAALHCHERLDDKAMRSLRYIEQRSAGCNDWTSTFAARRGRSTGQDRS